MRSSAMCAAVFRQSQSSRPALTPVQSRSVTVPSAATQSATASSTCSAPTACMRGRLGGRDGRGRQHFQLAAHVVAGGGLPVLPPVGGVEQAGQGEELPQHVGPARTEGVVRNEVVLLAHGGGVGGVRRRRRG